MNEAILLFLFPAAAALAAPLGQAVSERSGRLLALAAYLAGLVYGILLYPGVRAEPRSIVVGNWPPPFGINFYLSPLTLGLVLLVFFAATLLLLFNDRVELRAAWARPVGAVFGGTTGGGRGPEVGGGGAAGHSAAPFAGPESGGRMGQFYLLYSLLVMAAVGIILTADLFNVFVFLEIGGIATFALVASGDRAIASAGALRYLVPAQLTTLLMLAGIALVYSATGVVNIASLSSFARLNPAFAFLVGLLILLPVLLELKQFPFNSWVGGAYRGATPVVGATMSGLTTIAIVMLLARLLLTMMNGSSAFALAAGRLRLVVLSLGALTVLIGEIAAFRESELKRVLAYSSAGQMGMIALGIAIATSAALKGVLFLLVSHTLAKALLFIVDGVTAKLSGSERWNEMKGVARRYPLLGIFFAIGALALMGIPLFSGFWGKLDLIRAAVSSGGIYLVAIAVVLLATVIEGVYFMKIAHTLFVDEPAADGHAANGHGVPAGVPDTGNAAGAGGRLIDTIKARRGIVCPLLPYRLSFFVPALLLSAGVLVLGILPGLIEPWIQAGAAELLHPAGYVAAILSSGGAQ